MHPHDGQAEVLESIEARLEHPALDAETLGRTVLLLECFVRSGLLDEDDAAALLAERLVGTSPAACEVGGWISLAEAERIVLAMMTPPEAAP